MTRQEHLTWCKKRALEYVDNGDCPQAFASMLSDMRKHPETANHSALDIMTQMFVRGFLSSETEMRKFIEGFN